MRRIKSNFFNIDGSFEINFKKTEIRLLFYVNFLTEKHLSIIKKDKNSGYSKIKMTRQNKCYMTKPLNQ